jgi:hypothetical protein
MTVSLAALRVAIPDLHTDARPPPLVPPEIDLRNVPIPREAFARLAVAEFGIDIEVARDFINEAADRVEGKRPSARPKARRRS